MLRVLISGFQGLTWEEKSGDNGTVDTPVPIPNTEVKHSRGEGSWLWPARITRCQAFFYAFFCLNKYYIFFVDNM